MSAEWFVRIIVRYWPLFLRGAGLSLLLALVGTLAGLLIGLGVASVKSLPPGRTMAGRVLRRAVNLLLTCYIELFRSTPMMVQAMVIYYGSEMFFGISVDKLTAAFFIISINTGAYMSEIVRGGIFAVPKGQVEACRAIGLTHGQSMLYVVLPQTLRNILPATANEFIINLKDSSVLNIISVNELFFVSRSVAGANIRYFETFLITSVIYLAMTLPMNRLLKYFERRMDGPRTFNVKEVAG